MYRKYRHRKASRNSGGIVVYVRNEYKNGITLVRKNHDTMVWFKFDKTFFNIEEDNYFVVVYLWSDNSPIVNVIDADLFICLHSDIEHFSSKGIVIVGGNCNARTACKPDFVLNDRYIPELDGDDYQADCNLPRFSLDKGSSSHGNRLLDLCKAITISIVNGRLGEDHGTGKFTCYNSQGASVSDYLLLNKSYFNVLNTFNVCDFNEYSDHAPLHVSIVCTTVVNARDERSRSEEYVKWSDEHKETYRSCLIGLFPEFNRLVMNNENDSPACHIIYHPY